MGASAKIVLFTSKKLSDNRHPVLLRIVIDRKPMYFNVGYNLKCIPDQWDEVKSQFNKSFPNWKEANRNIHTAFGKAEKILIDLQNENPNFTHSDFKEKFIEKNNRIYLFDYMEIVIARLKAAGKIGNAETYNTALNVFYDFLFSRKPDNKGKKPPRDKDIEMTEVDIKKLQLFIEHCQGKGLKPNSINNYLRTLRAVYNRAIKEEDFEYYPFKNFNWKPLKSKTAKRAIAKPDMKSILNYHAEPGTSLYYTREFFKFMYLCYGLNFSDLAKIEERNIIKADGLSILQFYRSKGGKLYEIALNEDTIQILDYFRANNIGSKYIFPILNESIHKTPEQIKTRIKTALKKFNNELRQIAKETGIEGNITSYVSRHTFASVLAKSGTDILTISEMLGHSDLKTTQIYLKELDHSEKISASKNLLN